MLSFHRVKDWSCYKISTRNGRYGETDLCKENWDRIQSGQREGEGSYKMRVSCKNGTGEDCQYPFLELIVL